MLKGRPRVEDYLGEFTDKIDEILSDFIHFFRRKELNLAAEEKTLHAMKSVYYLCGEKINKNG